MKRLIKYWNRFTSDKHQFSDCSTKYEILDLVNEDAGPAELKRLALKHGIKLQGRKVYTEADNTRRQSWRHSLKVTHAMKVSEVKRGGSYTPNETYQVWIGFITLPERGPLTPVNSIDSPVSLDLAREIVEGRHYGVADCGEHVDGQTIIVKEGWRYYHEIKLLGYSLESFEKILDAEDYGFEDDTEMCSKCCKFDSRDNGYKYNFRYVDSEGSLGINCGCFDEYCRSEDALEHYADNPDEAMELDSAKAIARRGKIRHIERFKGGWPDGRSGYFEGKSTREGRPKDVLKEYQDKYPNKRFIFSIDGSGPFQSYFSIWEIRDRKAKRKAA